MEYKLLAVIHTQVSRSLLKLSENEQENEQMKAFNTPTNARKRERRTESSCSIGLIAFRFWFLSLLFHFLLVWQAMVSLARAAFCLLVFDAVCIYGWVCTYGPFHCMHRTIGLITANASHGKKTSVFIRQPFILSISAVLSLYIDFSFYLPLTSINLKKKKCKSRDKQKVWRMRKRHKLKRLRAFFKRNETAIKLKCFWPRKNTQTTTSTITNSIILSGLANSLKINDLTNGCLMKVSSTTVTF